MSERNTRSSKGYGYQNRQGQVPDGNYREQAMRRANSSETRMFRNDYRQEPIPRPADLNRRPEYNKEQRRFADKEQFPKREGEEEFKRYQDKEVPFQQRFRTERFQPYPGPKFDLRYPEPEWQRHRERERWNGPQHGPQPPGPQHGIQHGTQPPGPHRERRFEREGPIHREYFPPQQRRDERFPIYPRDNRGTGHYRMQNAPPPTQPARDYFPGGRPRSPKRTTEPYEKFPRPSPYMADRQPNVNSPSLMLAMNNQRRSWGVNNNPRMPQGTPYLLKQNDITTSNVAEKQHPPKASLLQAKKEHFSEPERNDSDESDDDMYDQDYIEEQIDRIDNEIAKQERLLAAVRLKMVVPDDSPKFEKVEEKFEPRIKNFKTGHFVEDSLNEEQQKLPMEHNSNPPVSYSQLVESIYAANRQLSKQFKMKSQSRNMLMFNLSNPESEKIPSYDPKIFDTAVIDGKLRPMIVAFISSKIISRNLEQKHLWEKYKGLDDSWQVRVAKLESKMEKIPVVKKPQLMEPLSATGRSTRRSGIRSDVVRSEAEWQKALSTLGIEDKTFIFSQEKGAKDIPMISRADIQKQYTFLNNNDLVVNAERDLQEFNQNLDLKWTEYDCSVFRLKLSQLGKDFFKIAQCFDNKTTQDCVAYYYREKVNQRFKNLLRRSNMPGRGRKRKEKEEEVDPCGYSTYVLDECEEVYYEHRKEENSEEEEAHVTVPQQIPTPAKKNFVEELDVVWTDEERATAIRQFENFGRDFQSVSSIVGTKTVPQCKALFNSIRRQQKEEEKNEPKKRGRPGPKPKKKKDEEVVENDEEALKRKNKELDKKKSKKVKSEVEEETQEEGARKTISYWSVSERQDFILALGKFGRNWETISKTLETKSPIQVRNYFHNSRKKLSLDKVLEDAGHSLTSTTQSLPPTSQNEKRSNIMDMLNPVEAVDEETPKKILVNSEEMEFGNSMLTGQTLPKIRLFMNSPKVHGDGITANSLVKENVVPFSFNPQKRVLIDTDSMSPFAKSPMAGANGQSKMEVSIDMSKGPIKVKEEVEKSPSKAKVGSPANKTVSIDSTIISIKASEEVQTNPIKTASTEFQKNLIKYDDVGPKSPVKTVPAGLPNSPVKSDEHVHKSPVLKVLSVPKSLMKEDIQKSLANLITTDPKIPAKESELSKSPVKLVEPKSPVKAATTIITSSTSPIQSNVVPTQSPSKSPIKSSSHVKIISNVTKSPIKDPQIIRSQSLVQSIDPRSSVKQSLKQSPTKLRKDDSMDVGDLKIKMDQEKDSASEDEKMNVD